MIDSGTATVLAVTAVEAAGIIFWGGITEQRIRALQADVKPVAGLGKDLARLEERVEHLIGLLENRRRNARGPVEG